MTTTDVIDRFKLHERDQVRAGLDEAADQRSIRIAAGVVERRLRMRRPTDEAQALTTLADLLRGRIADAPAPEPTISTEEACSLLAAAHLAGMSVGSTKWWCGYDWVPLSVCVRTDPILGTWIDSLTAYAGGHPLWTRSGWISDPILAPIRDDLRILIRSDRDSLLAYRTAESVHAVNGGPGRAGRAFLVADGVAAGAMGRAEAAAARVRDWLGRHPLLSGA